MGNMAGNDTAHLIYLVLLGTAIAGYFFVSARESWGKLLQLALMWGMIFVGAVAVAGLWPALVHDNAQVARVEDSGTTVEVPRSVDGHYHLVLTINGSKVQFVVDTGATEMVLSRSDAEAVGIDTASLAYLGRANTANGMVPLATVMLDEVMLGPIVDRNVRASVNGGEMNGSLLGMGYLQRFDRIEIVGDRLVLTRRECVLPK